MRRQRLSSLFTTSRLIIPASVSARRPPLLLMCSLALLLLAVACQPSSAPASPQPPVNTSVTAASPPAPSGAGTPQAVSTLYPATFRLELTPVVRGLQQPIHVTSAGDGSGVLYAVEKVGTIRAIANGAARAQPFLDIRSLVRSQEYERGLLGLAFHPNYRANRLFYVNYTNQQGHTTITRYTTAADGSAADPASGKQILFIEQPFANHNGGNLIFGPDGKLWIGMGDGGGGGGDPHGNAQNRGQLLGKMLRIDVDNGDPYGIPADNPFVAEPGTRPEIWGPGCGTPGATASTAPLATCISQT